MADRSRTTADSSPAHLPSPMSLQFEYDEAAGVVRHNGRELGLADPEAFDLISQAWLRTGWDTKYV